MSARCFSLALQLVARKLAQARRDPLLDAAAWTGGSAAVASALLGRRTRSSQPLRVLAVHRDMAA
jgi:hypothetical protein